MRYSALTILADAGNHPLKTGRLERKVLCQCDCGAEAEVWVSCIATGNTKSCGCLRVNMGRQKNLRHGMAKTPEYRAWNHMLARCNNPRVERYPIYGGRGIRVADEWQGEGGFDRFYAHIGPRPSPEHSVDRIDTNGNYEPGNVRWADLGQQAANRRNTRLVEINGRVLTLRAACIEMLAPYGTVSARVRRGMDPLRAIMKSASEMTSNPPPS